MPRGWSDLRETCRAAGAALKKTLGGSRGYLGCTMLWDREVGWYPHELVAGPSR